MKITSREAVLSWVVGMLLLGSISYWVAAPKLKVWKETRESRQRLTERIALLERLVQQQGTWSQRLDVLKTKLVRYAADQDVTADYLKILERVAQDSLLNLEQRRPQSEKRHGDLYRLAIDCTWEGKLESLVRFLYALDQEEVAMDVEELTVSLVPSGQGRMKGTFTLMCIYGRAAMPATPAAAVPPPSPPSAAE